MTWWVTEHREAALVALLTAIDALDVDLDLDLDLDSTVGVDGNVDV